MKFSRVKQFLKSKKVIRTGACVLAAVIVTGGVGAYHVYGQKMQKRLRKPHRSVMLTQKTVCRCGGCSDPGAQNSDKNR